MLTDLQTALDQMGLPFQRIDGVAGILAALETTDNAINPAHLMPLGEALFQAMKEIRQAYAIALRETQLD